MTNSNYVNISNGLARKAAGRVSMISLLAISVGIAAAPANAQNMIDPSVIPMQSPVAAPPPAPAPTPVPTMQSAPVTIMPPAQANATPPANRADDLATKGGFDATTVAPEALAQIETEQQARKAAAAKSAAAKAAAAPARTTSAPANRAADIGTDSMSSSAAAADDVAPVAGFDNMPPMVQPAATAPERVSTPADTSGDADWGMLAALAALLGVGGAGAYAATRRRKTRGQQAADIRSSDPVPAPVTTPATIDEAIMPELRNKPVEGHIRPAVAAAPISSTPAADTTAQTRERRVATKVAFADFVANMPNLEEAKAEEPRVRAARAARGDRHVKIGQRRVAAAPKPYLGEADLNHPEGYFTANVDAMPTPQNPFLTRQKRLKRAQQLDGTLAEMKAATGNKRSQLASEMEAKRKLEPAFS